MSKINLLHLTTGLGIGGAEKVVLDLASNASTDLFNVNVVSIGKEQEMLNRFEKKNLFPEIIGVDNNIKGLLKSINSLNSIVRNRNIDIIHAHMFHALLLAVAIKLLNYKVKIIFTPHSINLEHVKREIFCYLTKSLREKDIIFSDLEKIRYYNKDVVIIPNGIEIPHGINKREQPNKFSFICVGGLRVEKNYVELIEKVISSIPDRYQFVVNIAGKGPMKEAIERMIKVNKLDEKVVLLGLRDDISELLEKSNAFLMPSKWEGFPIALLEAGSFSLPVLATPVGNIPSIINEKTGYLSDIDHFAEQMCNIMEDYDKALEKGKALRNEIIRKYSIKSVVKRHESLYLQIINSKKYV